VAPIRTRFRFSGRVQGVSFRQFVRNRSAPLAIGGFVRNLPDGTVEAELEGEPDALEEMVRALHEDHRWARIERIDRENIPLKGSRPPVQVC
jgi:acylphosphatase